jgi:hypothetical protein
MSEIVDSTRIGTFREALPQAVNKINAASAEEYFCVRIVIPDC